MAPLIAALLLAASDAGTGPLELGKEVRALYDDVTCQAPAADVTAAYCKRQLPRFERFKTHWGSSAQQFLTSLQPKDLPDEVVYPFGGGDLMMALATFPHAKVITTLSLELAGDPRRIATAGAASIKKSLDALAETSASTLTSNDSKSVNLSKIQQGDLPGQLSMHLIGLGLWGYVPVSARFFRIEPDGTLHYFTREEADALEGQTAQKLKSNWRPPDFSPAFANVELAFVPANEPNATPRVFRHIGANLSDEGLKAAPGVLAHLAAKGKVAAMTKAASYLMWRSEFSMIRDFLVAHARFMVSDSTGVLPRFWGKGCTVKTYGAYDKSFLGTYALFDAELANQFATQPKRALPMRFGYPDGSPEKKGHLFTADCPEAP